HSEIDNASEPCENNFASCDCTFVKCVDDIVLSANESKKERVEQRASRREQRSRCPSSQDEKVERGDECYCWLQVRAAAGRAFGGRSIRRGDLRPCRHEWISRLHL